MKVLYLITKSNFGGAQKYVFELATGARDRGYEVAVAAGGTGEARAACGLLAEKLVTETIPFIHIKNFMRDISPLRDIVAFFEVLKIVLKEKPDVLHISSTKAGGIGVIAGRLAGIKNVIFTSHGLTIDETWRPKWQRILIYLATMLMLRLAHTTIMISSETFERASAIPLAKNRVRIIKNGIAGANFLEKRAARASLAPHVPQQSFWVGGIGELHQNKNWSALIEAIATLPKRVHLLIIGEGEQRSELEKLIHKLDLDTQIHLLGYTKDAYKYLKAFDVFVLPSKKEGLPYVILEAGLAELPVVASDLPGIRDIIETGREGLLVEPTPKLLSTSLQMLVRDDSMRRAYGATLRRRIETEFSLERMYTETFLLYDTKTSAA